MLKLELIAEYMPILREHRCMWVHNVGTRMAQGKSRIREGFGGISLVTVVWLEARRSSPPQAQKQGGLLVVLPHAQRPGNKLSAFLDSVD